jgi:hypothetical protein
MHPVTDTPPAAFSHGAPEPKPRLGRLRWWIVGALALHFAAWAAWFTIASRHPVSEVPLATSGRH